MSTLLAASHAMVKIAGLCVAASFHEIRHAGKYRYSLLSQCKKIINASRNKIISAFEIITQPGR